MAGQTLGTIAMNSASTLSLGSGDAGRASTISIQTVQSGGAWTGTLTIQATIDGTNWVAVYGVPADSTSPATTIAAGYQGITRIDATGYELVRLSGAGDGANSVVVTRSAPKIG